MQYPPVSASAGEPRPAITRSQHGRWMAALVTLLAAASLPAHAAAAVQPSADPGPAMTVVRQLTFAHVDEADPDSLYRFLAVVPTSVRVIDGRMHEALLASDDPAAQRPLDYLVKDFVAYCKTGGSTPTLRLVGPVRPGLERELVARGAAGAVQRIDGSDASEVSFALATRCFCRPTAAVVAPLALPATDADMLCAANAAALAARLGRPLLLIRPGDSARTATRMRALGLTRITVLDTERRLDRDQLTAALAPATAVDRVLASGPDIAREMRARTGRPVICLAQDRMRALAATVAAARYGGTVQLVPPELVSASLAAARKLPRWLLTETHRLTRPLAAAEDEPSSGAFTGLADLAYRWMARIGVEDTNQLEVILNFSSGGIGSGVSLMLDRALIGDPRRPTERGAVISRLPGSWSKDLVYIGRSSLYPALIHVAPRPDRVTMMMVATEVNNTGPQCSLGWTDWENVAHKANEFFGVHDGGYQDPGVYASFKAGGYDVGFHNGRHPGEGTDPVNHEPRQGFWKEFRDGSTFVYSASHGSVAEFYPLATDRGTVEEVAYGSPYWPSPEGRINVMGEAYTNDDWNADFESLHSMIMVFNACLVGGGPMNKTILDHGGAAAISSFTTVSFDGGGLWGCYLGEQSATPGKSLGEAFAYAMARTTECFARGQLGGDASLRFILFGDALMEFHKPGWTRPAVIDAMPQ